MNFIYKAVAILDIAIVLSTFPAAVYAQRSPNNPRPSISQLPEKTKPQGTNRVENNSDLSLLAKTIVGYIKGDLYQTESQMQIVASGAGANMTVNAKLNIIAKYPNSYRAEIQFIQPGNSKSISYLLVSNGTNILIYRPDVKQYAVTSQANFEKSNDAFLIGFSNIIFLKTPTEIKSQISTGALSSNELLAALQSLVSNSFNGYKQSVEGKEYYVYNFKLPDDKYTFKGFIDPAKATLNQIEITGKDEG